MGNLPQINSPNAGQETKRLEASLNIQGLAYLLNEVNNESSKAGFELQNLSTNLALQKLSFSNDYEDNLTKLQIYPTFKADVLKGQKKIGSVAHYNSPYTHGVTEITMIEPLSKETIFDYSMYAFPFNLSHLNVHWYNTSDESNLALKSRLLEIGKKTIPRSELKEGHWNVPFHSKYDAEGQYTIQSPNLSTAVSCVETWVPKDSGLPAKSIFASAKDHSEKNHTCIQANEYKLFPVVNDNLWNNIQLDIKINNGARKELVAGLIDGLPLPFKHDWQIDFAEGVSVYNQNKTYCKNRIRGRVSFNPLEDITAYAKRFSALLNGLYKISRISEIETITAYEGEKIIPEISNIVDKLGLGVEISLDASTILKKYFKGRERKDKANIAASIYVAEILDEGSATQKDIYESLNVLSWQFSKSYKELKGKLNDSGIGV